MNDLYLWRDAKDKKWFAIGYQDKDGLNKLVDIYEDYLFELFGAETLDKLKSFSVGEIPILIRLALEIV